MSSFRFDFNYSEKSSPTKLEEKCTTPCKDSREIQMYPNCYMVDMELEQLKLKDGTKIYFVNSQNAEKEISQEDSNDLAIALKAESDLVPNVYEGGLKVWECSIDLVHYLCEEYPGNLCDQHVLELGCGAGLPGIFAMMKGSIVHFQDYNEEVLRHVTIPSVCANKPERSDSPSNTPSSNTAQSNRFFSGDWATLVTLLDSTDQPQRYDLIFASETIYNPDSYSKLHDVFVKVLKQTGIVLVAAKTCYFGVGGGTRSFEQLVEKQRVFDCETVKLIETGVKREILKLTFKK